MGGILDIRMRTRWLPSALALAAALLWMSPPVGGEKTDAPVRVLGSGGLRTWCLVADLAFAGTSELVSLDCKARVQRWDLSTGAVKLDFAPDGGTLASAHVDTTVSLWDL